MGQPELHLISNDLVCRSEVSSRCTNTRIAIAMWAGPIIASMKRLALSIVGGVAIPFLYTIVAGPLSTYITNVTLHHYLAYPVRWPVIILYRFFPIEVSSNVVIVLSVAIICNVVLYTLITYVLLLTFSKPKTAVQLPPPPQQ